MLKKARKKVPVSLFLVLMVFSLRAVVLPVRSQGWRLYFPFTVRGWPLPTPHFDSPLISEVMYDPNGEEPAAEWIELYNPSSHDFDLSAYKIGDAWNRGDGEGMLRFPAGARIASGEVLVIANQAAKFYALYGFFPAYEMADSDPGVADMLKYSAWATRSVELTNNGDEVALLDAGDQVVDGISWGSSKAAFDPPVPKVVQGYSLERAPANRDRNLAGDWRGQDEPAPGRVDLVWPSPTPSRTSGIVATSTGTASPTVSPSPTGPISPSSTPAPFNGILLFSEVLYDAVDEPGGEWLELYNPGMEVISLKDFKIGDDQDPTDAHSEGMLGFPGESVILPGEAIVVANQAVHFKAQYGFDPDYEITNSDPAVTDLNDYPAWSSGPMLLNNAGDEILLLDGADQVVDALSWGDSNWAFDPAAADVGEGHSLERYPSGFDSDSAADWRDQPVPDPGAVDRSLPTPTLTNSPTLPPSPTPIDSETSQPSPSPTATATATLSFTPTPTPEPPDHLLVSEVLYNPQGSEPNLEWIEIYNPSADPVDLAAYKIGDEETFQGYVGLLCFPAGAQIESGQVLLVANQATDFYAVFGFLPDYEMRASHPDVPDMVKYLTWAGGNVELNNSGDEILMLDAADLVVDVVAYGSSTYPGFQPPVPGVVEGHSIVRCPVGVDTNTNQDWADQATPDPGQGCLVQP